MSYIRTALLCCNAAAVLAYDWHVCWSSPLWDFKQYIDKHRNWPWACSSHSCVRHSASTWRRIHEYIFHMKCYSVWFKYHHWSLFQPKAGFLLVDDEAHNWWCWTRHSAGNDDDLIATNKTIVVRNNLNYDILLRCHRCDNIYERTQLSASHCTDRESVKLGPQRRRLPCIWKTRRTNKACVPWVDLFQHYDASI